MPANLTNLAKLVVAFLLGGTLTGILSYISRAVTLGVDHPGTVISAPPILVGGILSALVTYFFIRSRDLTKLAERVKLLDAFEGAPEGIIIWGPDDRFVWCNAKYKSIRPNQTIFLTPDIRYPEYIKILLEKDILGADDQSFDEQYRERLLNFRSDKKIREDYTRSGKWILVNKKILPDGSVIGFHSDITERKLAEMRVIESEEQFRSLFDESNVGITITSIDGQFLRSNKAFEDLIGYTQSEIQGMTFKDITHPDDIEDSTFNRGDLLKRRLKSHDTEKRYARKDGSEIWVRLNRSLIYKIDGSPKYFIGHIQDITDRKKAEEKLRLSESRLADAVESLPIGIAVFDNNEQLVLFNNRTPATTGRDPDKLEIGMSAEQIITSLVTRGVFKDAVGREAEWITDRLQKFSDKGNSFENRTVDGRVLLNQYAPTSEGGTIGINLDITKERMAEETLRQAHKMEAVGLLTAGIAHDFNNMLSVVSGNIQLAISKPGDPKNPDRFKSAMEGVRKAANLTQRLLAYSRQQSLEPIPTDVEELVCGLSDFLRSSLGETIEIEISVEGTIDDIEVDQNQLESALLNLSVNARDAMPNGGLLTITSKNRIVDVNFQKHHPYAILGDYVSISISDNGTGMTKDIIGKVFDPFFTTKDVGKGSGLGLSMVFGFVKQSGGFVTIESEVGIGTTITMNFPSVSFSEGTLNKPAKPIQEYNGHGETVLVIEDEPYVRNITIETLENLGYQVIDGGDGSRAFDIVSQQKTPIDLVLSDVTLPNGKNGPDIARAIQAEWNDVKVLLVSGYPQEKLNNIGCDGHAYPLLPKPYEIITLAQKIHDLIFFDDDR